MKRLYIILLALGIVVGQGIAGEHWTNSSLHAQSGKRKKKDKKATKKGDKTKTDPKTKARIDYLFIEANTQYLQNEPADAVKLFKEILNLDAKHHASMYQIGKIAAEMGDLELAERYAKQALDLNEENYWYYHELVGIYEKQLKLDKAVEVQEALAAKFPEDKNALYDLAQLQIGRKQFDKAVATYGRLEGLIGMNEEVILRKHQLYMYLNQPDKALSEVDKLIAFNPNDQRFYQAKYDTYMMMNEKEKAQKVLEDLLRFNPNDGFALLSLADYYKAQGDLEKSDEFLYQAFRNPEVDLEAKLKILSGLYPYAETDKSVLDRMHKLSELLHHSHPESAIVNGIKGDILQVEGETDSARHYYLKSIEAEPANEQVWQELLFIDSETADYDQMRDDAEKALEYFPNQALFLYFFGIGSSQVDENEEAIYAFEKIKKIGVANRDLLLQAYISLGEIYHKEKEYQKSDENFTAALEMDGGNALVLNNFAYFLSLRNERLEEAEDMVQRALKIQPDSPAYQDTYGWILYLRGDYQKAEEWIGKAISGGGGDADVLEHYGDVWLKLGNEDKAREYWQRAKDKGADHLVIEDKLKNLGIK